MKLVTTRDQLDDVVDYFTHRAEYLCFDVETLGEHRGDPWRNVVAWISVGDVNETFVIPCGHPNGEFVERVFPLKETPDLQARLARGLKPRKSDYSTSIKNATVVFTDPPEHLDRTTVFGALKPLLLSDQLLKVGQNLAFDLGSVAKYLGDIPSGPYADTMIAAFLVDPDNSRRVNLKTLAKRYAHMDIEKGVGDNIAEHSFNDVAQYSGLDVVATVKVWEALRGLLNEHALSGTFKIEMSVLPVVTRMRLRGANLDMDALADVQMMLASDMESTKAAIYRLAGKKFNLNSTGEKQRLLYLPKRDGGRGLAKKVLTPGGKAKKAAGVELQLSDYSVAAAALERYRDTDELVTLMLKYADLNKLLSTYVAPYFDPKKSMADKGVVHTELVQIGAATGRFSSRNPNLQNIPSPGTHYGKLIRNLFVAPAGHALVVADYSQIEPRIIAAMSRDATMTQTYREGGDLYTAIGERMGVDRKAGKVLVLSISYGVGPDKISSQIGCSVQEARDLLDDFADKFPQVMKLKSRVILHAKDKRPGPYVTTLGGRRRYLPDLKSQDQVLRSRAERQAFNTVIQGSAADIMKMAMVFADEAIPDGAELILTVHDELVAVTPTSLADDTAEAIRSAMEDGFTHWRIPLLADVKVVEKWGQAK